MATYLAFLRAINLGAKRKFPKDAIRAAVEAAGSPGGETYINTGNVRLESRMRSRARIEQTLEAAFLADRGFEVPTIVLTPDELRAVAADAARFAEAARPALGHEVRHYVSLLKSEPSAESVRVIEESSSTDAVARVGGRGVHLLLGGNYHEARLTNAQVERHLGVATNRNLTVIRALAEKWC